MFSILIRIRQLVYIRCYMKLADLINDLFNIFQQAFNLRNLCYSESHFSFLSFVLHFFLYTFYLKKVCSFMYRVLQNVGHGSQRLPVTLSLLNVKPLSISLYLTSAMRSILSLDRLLGVCTFYYPLCVKFFQVVFPHE